jgi:hypothetical protein
MDDETVPGTATYRLPAAAGYTLLGAPTVSAKLQLSGDPSVQQLAARLWDVAPSGSQRLVARALYRPSGKSSDRFELHANGWRFARGHVPKLELLGNDAPYGRVSNQPFSIEVTSLEVRLPVRERTADGTASPRKKAGKRGGGAGGTVALPRAPAQARAGAVSGGSLPFTGLALLPLLITGLALFVGGALVRTTANGGPRGRNRSN